MLVTKTARAAAEYEVSAVHVSGGISSNRHLRNIMAQRCDVPVRFPPQILCTDNAAMIAAAAHWRFVAGRRDSLDMDVLPGLQL